MHGVAEGKGHQLAGPYRGDQSPIAMGIIGHRNGNGNREQARKNLDLEFHVERKETAKIDHADILKAAEHKHAGEGKDHAGEVLIVEKMPQRIGGEHQNQAGADGADHVNGKASIVNTTIRTIGADDGFLNAHFR